MNDSIEGSKGRSQGQESLPYEEARNLLEGRDHENLVKLASDEASFPEMLYFLSTDDDAEIRTKVAANPSTPIQADEVLSKDVEPLVRQIVGTKVARRLPTLSDKEEALSSSAISILERLIEDEEVHVRRIIAEELKATDKIPLHVVQKLARDIDDLVCTPVLHHSPLLDDNELISIIEECASTPKLKAIAERSHLSEPLAECIVETADVEAISQLLLNPSAQIRENTLDQLISGAKEIPQWHEPLAIRPKLPFGAILKIAGFVAGSLLEVLSQRDDIDDELRDDLEQRVKKRLAEENDTGEESISEPLGEIELRLRKLHKKGGLNEAYLREHSSEEDRNIVILSLAILADIPIMVSRRIFASVSAKAIMSLGWKAGVSASLASRIQGTAGKIPADNWILPNEEEEYPFSDREMLWQLELFLDQEESTESSPEKSLEMSAS